MPITDACQVWTSLGEQFDQRTTTAGVDGITVEIRGWDRDAALKRLEAYLRDRLAEVQAEIATVVCPVCLGRGEGNVCCP